MSLFIVCEFPRSDPDLAAAAEARIKDRDRQLAAAVVTGANRLRGQAKALADLRVFGGPVVRVLVAGEVEFYNKSHGRSVPLLAAVDAVFLLQLVRLLRRAR